MFKLPEGTTQEQLQKLYEASCELVGATQIISPVSRRQMYIERAFAKLKVIVLEISKNGDGGPETKRG